MGARISRVDRENRKMYYLNKIVGWCVSPMGILFLGLGLGWLIGRVDREKWRRGGRVVIGAALVGFWFLGTGLATRVIGVPLEGEEVDILHSTFNTSTSTLQYDAIVLLGGGMGFHGYCGRAEMLNGADRVWEAAKRWKQISRGDRENVREGLLPITLSGGGVEQSTVPLLMDLGVPREAMMFFPEARNTEEEAKLISAAGIKRILLVTSAWHMPRAKMLFERAGFDVTPAPTDYEMHCMCEKEIEFTDFIPSADNLMRNGAAIKEWIAYFGYKWFR